LLSPPTGKSSIMAIAVCACVAIALTVPYAWRYLATAEVLGGRGVSDVIRYSAKPIHYLTASPLSGVWGWTSKHWGSAELRLFPGLTVLVVAAIGPLQRPRRVPLLYAAIAVLAVFMSFGLHNPVYRWVFDRVEALQGLRATARLGIFADAALCVLAAFGA